MAKSEPIKDKIERLSKDIEPNNIIFDMNTAELTSVKTGGKVLCYLIADTMEDLKKIVRICSDNQINFMVIGDGTNILFNDRHLDMVLIKLGMAFKNIDFSNEDKITAGAAYRLFKMVVSAADRGYDFSELSGIPGTIGGSVAGNCGSKHKGVCDFIKEISYI